MVDAEQQAKSQLYKEDYLRAYIHSRVISPENTQELGTWNLETSTHVTKYTLVTTQYTRATADMQCEINMSS